MKCRFIVGAFPSERGLREAKYEAAGRFVRDMAKRGWGYLDKHGFKMTGPYPETPIMTLPKRSQQERFHTPSREMLAGVQAGHRFNHMSRDSGYARDVPLIAETDSWEFELAGVFVHETILTEVPDEHEERG